MRIRVHLPTGRVIGWIKVRFRFRLMVKTKESPFCPVHTFGRQNNHSTHTQTQILWLYMSTYIYIQYVRR